MINPTFETLVLELTSTLGSPKEHVSDSGASFTSTKKGKVTVYHSNVAAGNHAEIAIDIASHSARLGISEREMRDRIIQARAATGRSVDTNAQYDWPRIGLSSLDHVSIVLKTLRPTEP